MISIRILFAGCETYKKGGNFHTSLWNRECRASFDRNSWSGENHLASRRPLTDILSKHAPARWRTSAVAIFLSHRFRQSDRCYQKPRSLGCFADRKQMETSRYGVSGYGEISLSFRYKFSAIDPAERTYQRSFSRSSYHWLVVSPKSRVRTIARIDEARSCFVTTFHLIPNSLQELPKRDLFDRRARNATGFRPVCAANFSLGTCHILPYSRQRWYFSNGRGSVQCSAPATLPRLRANESIGGKKWRVRSKRQWKTKTFFIPASVERCVVLVFLLLFLSFFLCAWTVSGGERASARSNRDESAITG